jgi:hypothetical protein
MVMVLNLIFKIIVIENLLLTIADGEVFIKMMLSINLVKNIFYKMELGSDNLKCLPMVRNEI